MLYVIRSRARVAILVLLAMGQFTVYKFTGVAHADEPLGDGAIIHEACGPRTPFHCAATPPVKAIRLFPRVVGYSIASLGDLATTEYARSKGAGEGNILMGNRVVRIGLEVGSTLLSAKLDQFAATHGKKKVLVAGRIVLAIGSMWIVKSNVDVAAEMERRRKR